MIQKLRNFGNYFNFSENKGLAQIPLLLGLLLMAIAVPVATQLVKQNQDTRNKAAYGCSSLSLPTTKCTLNGAEYGWQCDSSRGVWVCPTNQLTVTKLPPSPTALPSSTRAPTPTAWPSNKDCSAPGMCPVGTYCVHSGTADRGSYDCVTGTQPTFALPMSPTVKPTSYAGVACSALNPCVGQFSCNLTTSKCEALYPTATTRPLMSDGTQCSITATATNSCGWCKNGHYVVGSGVAYCGAEPTAKPTSFVGKACSALNPCVGQFSCNLTTSKCEALFPTPSVIIGMTCENGTVAAGDCCKGGGMCVNALIVGVCNLNRTACPAPTLTSTPRTPTMTDRPMPTAAPCSSAGYHCKNGDSFYCSSMNLNSANASLTDIRSEDCHGCGCGGAGVCVACPAVTAVVTKVPTAIVPSISLSTPTLRLTSTPAQRLSPTSSSAACYCLANCTTSTCSRFTTAPQGWTSCSSSKCSAVSTIAPTAAPTSGGGGTNPTVRPTSGGGGTNPTAVPTVTTRPTATTAPGMCTQCPNDFKCYVNNGSYKWFSSYFHGDGYTLATGAEVTNCGGVVKPPFLNKAKGDANCDGMVDIDDRSLWTKEYTTDKGAETASKVWLSDFDCDSKVTIYDRSIWTQNFIQLNSSSAN